MMVKRGGSKRPFLQLIHKKSMIKIGSISVLALVFFFVASATFLSFTSSAQNNLRSEYVVGEKIVIKLGTERKYEFSLATPNETKTQYGRASEILFVPSVSGEHTLAVTYGGQSFVYEFLVNDEFVAESELSAASPSARVEVGKPVEWSVRTKGVNVSVPVSASDIRVISGGRAKPFRKSGEFVEVLGSSVVDEELQVRYVTPGPQKEELEMSSHVKQVKVFSDIHYTNVVARTNISEVVPLSKKDLIEVFWLEEGRNLGFEVIDANGNGIIDGVEWVAPHLSNQTFNVSIKVLNVQSYPIVGGNWQVRFQTMGSAPLTITAVNGTSFSRDLNFLEVRCGSQVVNATLQGDSVFVENYSCAEVGSETSQVVTSGKHHLEFDFGGEKAYAHNLALEPYKVVGEWGNVSDLQEGSWTTINFTAVFDDVPVVVHVADYDYDYDDNPCIPRIRNVTRTSFEIRAESWSPTGTCPATDVNAYWLAAEKGIHTLASSGVPVRTIEVQNFTLSSSACGSGANPVDYTYTANHRLFNNSWTSMPLVLPAVQTANDLDVITTYIRGCSNTNGDEWNNTCVEVGMNGMENDGATQPCALHTSDEEGGFIAWEMDSDWSNSESRDNTGNISNGLSYYTWEAFWEADTVQGSQNDAFPISADFVTLLTSYTEGAAFGTGTRIDGGNGLFPAIQYDAGSNQVFELADEDQYGDAEQSHTSEPFAVLFFNATTGLLYSNESLVFNVTINSPIQINYSTQEIVFNVTTNLSVQGCNYSIDAWTTNNTMETADNQTFNATNSSVPEGAYTANFICWDRYGNSDESEQVFFEVDVTAPAVTIHNPLNSTYNSSVFGFNVSVFDIHQDTCWYTNDSGVTNYTLPSCANISYSAAQGSTTLVLYANDSAGNQNESNVTFFVDSIYPLIDYAANAYPNEAVIAGTSIFTNVSVTEVNEVNITFDLYNSSLGLERTNTFTDGTRDVTWSLLDEGLYSYNVTIFDIANNQNSTQTRNITLDNTNPVVSYSVGTSVDGANVSRDWVFVNVSVTEVNEANVTFELFNSSGLVNSTVLPSGSRFINWTGLSDSVYSYNVTVFDLASQSASTTTRNITIDTTLPFIDFSVGTESNNTNVSRDWVFVNVTITEANEANVTFELFSPSGLVNSTVLPSGSRFINWTGLSDELYEYNVTVVDFASNQNSTQTRKIGLDTTGPVINITDPEAKTYGTNTSLLLNYTITDYIAGYDSCWWNIDNTANQSIACGTNTTFNTTDGEHTLYFYANDTFNNTGSSQVTFSVSTKGPVIELLSPVNDTFYSVDPTAVLFNYSSEDPDGVVACSLYGSWNGGWHRNQTDTSVTSPYDNFTLSLSGEGEYLWNVECNDTNEFFSFALKNFTIGIDLTNPAIDFTTGTEVNDSNRSQDWVFVNVSVNESNEANITFRLFNESNVLIANSTYVNLTRDVTWSGLDDGVYYYNVTLVDKAGRQNDTQTRVITLDTVGPTAVPLGPPNASYQNNATQNFTANVSDDNELANATLYIFNSTGHLIYEVTRSLVGLTTAVFGELYNFAYDGIFTWFYRVRDFVGNTFDTTNQTVIIDTEFPQIVYVPQTEDNATAFTRNWIFVNTTLNESNFANITFRLFKAGSSLFTNTFTDSTRSINWTLLTDDTYQYNVSAIDLANNVNVTDTRTIILDNVVPVVSYSVGTSVDGANVSRDWVFVNVSVTEVNEANVTFELFNSSGLVNSTVLPSGSRFINWTGLSDSVYSYNVTVFDLASQSASTTTRNITLDTVYPLIEYVSPTQANATFFERDWISANVSITDINEANVTFELFNSSGLVNSTVLPSGSRFINWTGLFTANVTYQYNVTARDYAGNTNATETRHIDLVDLTFPSLDLYEPESRNYTNNESVPVSYIAFDVNLDSCWYNLNGGANVTIANCQNTSLSLADGQTYTLTIYANDSLNQVVSQQVTFDVNTSYINVDVWKVQRGTSSVDGSTNPSLSSDFSPSKSFIVHTQRSSDSGPDSLFVMSDFVDENTINFQNYAAGAGATVEWEVVTGPPLAVSRDIEAFGTSDSTVVVPLSRSFNLSSSFLIVSTRLNSGTGNENQRARWTGRFVNDSALEFSRGVTGDAGEISWQAVEWVGAEVQNGSFSLSATSGTDTLSSSVNLSRSFLIFSSTTNSGTALDYNNVGGYLINDNTVRFYRQDDDAGSMSTEWFVVTAPVIDAQRGTFTITGATSPATTNFDQVVNTSRTFISTTWDSTGSGDTHANAIIASRVTGDTAMQTTTGTTATNVKNTSWQVIEIIELDPPTVSLFYPLDHQNFTGYDITQLNYSVEDKSSVLNCSLYGNWTGSWHVNQTVQSPAKETNNNFSSINTTADGFYRWNVECRDAYQNTGFADANFTFSTFLPPESPLLLNASQTSNDGLGNVTLEWNQTDHALLYRIYHAPNLSTEFTFLNETASLNLTDVSFAGSQRRFYRVEAWNPIGSNNASDYFGAHRYTLRHNGNTRNWLGFPTNFSYLRTANETRNDIVNATAVTLWNATLQQRVTCNNFSCPNQPSCTATNCNFDLERGRGYEINMNTSGPNETNWSGVGIVYPVSEVNLTKNATSFGKNWVSLYANTSLVSAQQLFENISSADAVSLWNSSLQTSQGLVFIPAWNIYVGSNFSMLLEGGFEVSVNASTVWNQS